ncbi:MAG: trigger factor [Mycoplasma sp.]
MKLSNVEQQKNKVVCSVEVDSAKWAEIIENQRKKAAKNLNIDGFRKGKVPANIAMKHVSTESVLIDAANTAINESLSLIDDDKRVKSLNAEVFPQPSVEVGNNFSEKELKFDLVYWIMPTATISNYKDLKLNLEKATVSKEEIDAELDNILSREKMLSKKSNDTIAKGDQVKFDFTGSVDGVEFEGGKAENFDLEIGSGQFIPGFEDQMVGLKIGEEKDLKVTFPKEYHAKNLAGKDSIFKVKIKEIHSISKPKLDEAFIKGLKLTDDSIKTPDQFKKYIEKAILDSKSQQLSQTNVPLLNTAIVENSKYEEIPEVILDAEKKQLKATFIDKIKQMNFKLADFLKMTGQSEEDFENEMIKQAKANIIVQCAIDHIAEVEKIKVDKKQIDEQYELLSKAHNTPIEEIKKHIDADALEEAILREEVTKKLLDWNSKK